MATAKTTKTAAKKATTTTAAKKAAPAKKAAAKKTTKKATAKKAAPAAKKATREIPAKRAGAAANGSFKRLADQAASFTAQVGKTAGAFAHNAGESAAQLAGQARTKAESSVSKTHKFIKDHPGEAAALAAAGLTVAAAILGRNRGRSLAKAAVAAGLVAKSSAIGKRATDLAKKFKAHVQG